MWGRTSLFPLLCLAFLLNLVPASPHDEIQAKIKTYSAAQRYTAASVEGESPHVARTLSGASSIPARETCEQVVARAEWGAIRIGYEIMEGAALSSATRSIVEELITQAIDYMGKAIQVRRTLEPLRVQRIPSDASNCWQFTWEDSQVCSNYSARPQCGSIEIPEQYMMSTRTCSKRCACTSGCTSSSQLRGEDCPDTCDSDEPLESGAIVCENCTTLLGGSGAIDEDLHIFVTVAETDICQANADLRAYASWCVKDQCDRPIFGSINFCASRLTTSLAERQTQVLITIHELTHAMVFSESLYKFFRNTDGSPMMPRESSDPDRLLDSVRWSCYANGSSQYPTSVDGVAYEHVDISPTIVEVFSERGFWRDACRCPLGKSEMQAGCLVPDGEKNTLRQPSCVLRMKTPAVVAETRAFFGCASLAGAELENQDTSLCTIIGGHWEQRVFNGELMAPFGSKKVPTYISRVTLALFEDSGWYKPNYSMADVLIEGMHWGYKQGCRFATDKCMHKGKTPFPRHWCTTPNSYSCSFDRTGINQCPSLGTISRWPGTQFKYFTDDSIDISSVMDYCPSASIVISNRGCMNASSATFPNEHANHMLEVFGTSSRCLMSTLHTPKIRRGRTVYQTDAATFSHSNPVCYDTECFASGSNYVVKIAKLDTSIGATLRTCVLGLCTSSGQILKSNGTSLAGNVICAAPVEVCYGRTASTALPPDVFEDCGVGQLEQSKSLDGSAPEQIELQADASTRPSLRNVVSILAYAMLALAVIAPA